METKTILAKRNASARERVAGLIFVCFGLLVLLVFKNGLTANTLSTFGMTPGGVTRGVVADWQIQSNLALTICGVVLMLIGAFQFLSGFGRATFSVLVSCCLIFVFAFLLYVSADKRLNLAGMLSSAVAMAVPIILGGFGGLLCERSGVVNVAIEGMMLMGAMLGAVFGSISKNIWIGLGAAMIGGALLATVHAWLSIKYKINQVISGTVINIFSTGMTSYISSMYLQRYQNLNKTPRFPNVSIPILADIPFIGPIFFNNSLFVYGMFLLLIILQFALFRTRWGLRLRSVGEHPKAADTLGINVFKTRYQAVILGGMIAGFAGAYFSLGSVGRFDEGMTAGKGFIGLAAMNFGNWNPVGTMLAGLLFGFADSMATSVSVLGSRIPGQFINMLPYIVTMVVLAGLVGGSVGPAASGTPYEKE